MLVSPFAPHTAEELWEAYGHAGGLAAARWPVVDEAAARAESIVVPVQVNGKVRGRLTVRARHHRGGTRAAGAWPIRRCCRTWRARRSRRWWWPWAAGLGGGGMIRRGLGDSGTRGPGAALTRRQALGLAPLAGLALVAGGCGYSLAGRGSFLPDYMQVIGVPMFGNRTPYSPLEQMFTEKVRVEFQSRGRYQVLPADTGVDGVVRGDITNVGAAPVGFNAEPAGLALPLHGDGQRVARRRARAEDAVGEPGAELQRRVRAGQRRQRRARRRGVHRLRSAPPSTGSARDFARSVVSAILEAF